MRLITRAILAGLFAAGWQARAGMPPIQTVFVIVMENHSWSEIRDNTNAPYINNVLLPIGSHCENYNNVPGIHPSLPNYLWLEAGTNFGIYDDNTPIYNHQNWTNHLVTQLKNAGISWKLYQQNVSGTSLDLDGNCNCSIRHDPFVYFDDVTGTNNFYDAYGLAHIRPFIELEGDLTNNAIARYTWIVPDDCNDMHTACGADAVLLGDSFLAVWVPKILASAAYQKGGALFILWDETDSGDTRIPMIVISPFARGGGYGSTNYYTHGSTLRSMQEILGVGPFLGDAARVPDLGELFFSGAFEITGLTNIASNVSRMTVICRNTNSPLVCEASSDLFTWNPVWTNPAPAITETATVTNNSTRTRFYRFRQTSP